MGAKAMGNAAERIARGVRVAVSGKVARILIVATLTFSLVARSAALAAEDEIDARTVNEAIDGAADFLLSRQEPSGSWEQWPGQPAGLSALCTLALLNAGRKPSDPRVSKALDHLVAQKPEMVYASSLIVMSLCAADPEGKRYSEAIRKHAMWLESVQVQVGIGRGGWTYGHERNGAYDNSNSQFALLALYEAKRTLPDLKIQALTWQTALDYWLSRQCNDGSWTYKQKEDGDSSGSMTCAGITSVIIASGQVNALSASFDDSGNIRCCGSTREEDAVENGLRWLGNHFKANSHPRTIGEGIDGDFHLLYYLYGVERVGRMTARRFFVGHKGQHYDWYRMVSEFLVRQRRDPIWGGFIGEHHAERNPLVSTSLALLFLSKGRRPIVMSKAQWGEPGSNDWDHHRGGVHNVVTHIERLWKRDLSWQTISMSGATVGDLMETPILFMSGSEALKLNEADEVKLKRYLEQGGFLFAEACDGDGCDGKEFDASFRRLMAKLFPESQLRLLPPDHPVWFAEQRVSAKQMKPLLGLDTCCRTAVVYCPENLSCLWELKRPDRGTALPKTVQERVDGAVAIAANVAAYATNRELKEKLDRPQLSWESSSGKTPKRGALVIPKLAHSGGADDAVHAVANLMQVLQRDLEIRTEAQRQILAPDDPKLLDYPIAYIHGRRAFRFTAAEREALRTYLQRGGFLMGDAICGSNEFATSFRREMEAIFPEAKLEAIPADHPLMLNEVYRGFDISTVSLRDPQARGGAGDPLKSRIVKTAPVLEGIKVDDRFVVVFSPYDLSCALEKANSPDCKGYTRDDAAKIAANIVLYALQE